MEKPAKRNIVFLFSWLVLFFSLLFITKYSQSHNGFEVIGLYALGFIAYISILFQADHFPKKYLYTGTILVVGICFIELPFLSNDYFRFIWDGEMLQLGINPYDFTPNQLIQKLNLNDCYFLDLYAGMGKLSRANYSCYPTVNQGYFYLSTFTNNIWLNAFILRGLMVATLVIAIPFIEKLLNHFNYNVKRIFVLILNPLVLVECLANLHFELVMVSFLLMSFYFLLIKKPFISALLFAITVHVKLIPLLILPFFLSYLGWKKALRYFITVGIFIVVLFALLIRPDNYMNFLMSLKLYFKTFEFNSFLLYPYLQYGKYEYGWNMMYKFGPQLAQIALLIILGTAWNKRVIDKKEMFRRILLGVMVYYFFTSTVHPWYWVFPLGIAILEFSWTLILISFFTVLSYGLYATGFSFGYRVILMIVNGLLLLLYLVEVFRPELFKKIYPKILN